MSDTEFTFFFPPYSVLYWYKRYADGSLAAELAAQKQVVEALLAYPNVKIYYFQDDYLWVNGFTSFSVKPLRIATMIGGFCASHHLVYHKPPGCKVAGNI